MASTAPVFTSMTMPTARAATWCSFVEGLTGSERAAALQLAQQTQWRNKAVSDLYEPGSVFKLITCAAAREGVRSPKASK